ncbi:alpha/beta fold hydrolase [Kutzneria chonburiensis]|uniref:Alpha/beta fold hydrolase n=1 Tax=Kutzneria chonburiensis TaxID=1483604 RepID=A0ABV6N500_9PSEU|nr:alpha/beta hydrolase [Kutzneria chonburiensis]
MTLHVHEFGPADGRPAVFLHGLTGHGGRWRLLAEQELPDFRVLAPDLRGHGNSTQLPPWTLDQNVIDVLDVLDTLGLDRVPLVGHSYGGATAMHLTARAPERVEKLALLDPSTGLAPERCFEIAVEECEPELWPSMDAARTDFAEMWSAMPAEAIELELSANFEQRPDGQWQRRYLPAMSVSAWSEMSRPPVLPPPSTRTLLLPATKADFVAPELVAALRDRLGDDLTVRAVDSGHVLYLEQPKEVGALLREFLCQA